MLGVGREAEDLRVQRLRRVEGGRDDARRRPGQVPDQDEHQDRRHRGHDDEAEMDPGGGVAEHGEDQRVGDVDARRLQVVGGGVGRHALEKELAEVRVLALVAIEREVEQPEANRRRPHEDEAEGEPGDDAGLHGRIL